MWPTFYGPPAHFRETKSGQHFCVCDGPSRYFRCCPAGGVKRLEWFEVENFLDQKTRFAPDPEGYPTENFFRRIEVLLIGFNYVEEILSRQNSFEFRATQIILRKKKIQFFPEQDGYLHKRLVQYNWRPTYVQFLKLFLTDHKVSSNGVKIA